MADETIRTIIEVDLKSQKAEQDFVKATNEIKNLKNEVTSLTSKRKELDLTTEKGQKLFDDYTVQISKTNAEIKSHGTVLNAAQKAMNSSATTIETTTG